MSYPINFWPAPDVTSVADEDGNLQFMIPFYGALRPRPLNNILFCWISDVTTGGTYVLTGVGATPYTYIALKLSLGSIAANCQNQSTLIGMLLVYE
jgi:hypothetical protein